MSMKKRRLVAGLIKARMKSAIDELIPPRRAYCFLLIVRNESTIHPKINLSAQGIMTMLAAMVVIAGEILF